MRSKEVERDSKSCVGIGRACWGAWHMPPCNQGPCKVQGSLEQAKKQGKSHLHGWRTDTELLVWGAIH